SSLYELTPGGPHVYYLEPVLSCLTGYALSIMDNDDITGELWSVNIMSSNAVLSDLYSIDLSAYNGLGKGLTPSNLRFLNANNTEACIANRGDMHFDYVGASYRSPKTQPVSTVFVSDLWISGLDSANNIHGAFQRYRQNDHNDFFPGPLDPLTGGTDSAIAWRYDRIWSVTQYEISEFQWNFAQGNVQNGSWLVPRDIEEWPARGNTNMNGELAPFVDVNGNGIYDPIFGGDYPFIRGEQEMFWVFNDKLAPHSESTALPLGVQINATARAYYCSNADDSIDLVNEITLYEFDIINRSGSTYTHVVVSWAQDIDLGYWSDDYVGCDTLNNAGYSYNGDSIDETLSPYPGFGNYPPIAASIVLSGPPAPAGDLLDNDHDGVIDEPGEEILLSGFQYYQPGVFGPTGMPLTGSDYFRYQRGYWKDSVPLTIGGNGYTGVTPTTYSYSGNPLDTSQWNETSGGQAPGDRFMFLNCGPTTLYPGDTIHFTIAVVVLQDSSLSWGTQAYHDQLPQACAKVRNWHANDSWPGCGAVYDDVEEPENNSAVFNLYPNPASEQITLELPPLEEDARIVITDVTGRVIYSEKAGNNRTTNINVVSFAAGVYFVTLLNGDHSGTQKFIRN
ncbi:MAG TPA: T9SS type A sorting domain-containing protein, partial [Bacteroidia bacterium]|nr:T9SS type A sorting domain-containing protein [Bacteroidia bacterium]